MSIEQYALELAECCRQYPEGPHPNFNYERKNSLLFRMITYGADWQQMDDMAKWRHIRNFAYQYIPIATPPADYHDFWKILIGGVLNESGCWCAGVNYVLTYLYSFFGYVSVSANYGFADSPTSHALTLVRKESEVCRIYAMDGYLGYEFHKNGRMATLDEILHGDPADIQYIDATGDLPKKLIYDTPERTGLCKLSGEDASAHVRGLMKKFSDDLILKVDSDNPHIWMRLLLNVGIQDAYFRMEVLDLYKNVQMPPLRSVK